MYAFRPVISREPSNPYSRVVDAVWFKRKSGVITAAVGSYRLHFDGAGSPPVDGTYETWVALHGDNRYGGNCSARWNGEKFWSTSEDPNRNAARLTFLQVMLAGYPAPPEQWDGWYEF
jgi:hypothetical protein